MSGQGAIELRDSSRGARTCRDSGYMGEGEARKVQAQLEAARSAAKQAQQALDALEDEARRAGALPGWIR